MVTAYTQTDDPADNTGIQACSDLSQEADTVGDSEVVAGGSAGFGNQVLTVDAQAARRTFYYEGDPSFGNWDDQDVIVRFNINTGDADFEWDDSEHCRITAGGGAVETLGKITGQATVMSGSSASMTIPGQVSLGAASDHFYIICGMSFGAAVMHGTVSITIDNNSQVDHSEEQPPAGDSYLPAYIARHRLIPFVTR